MAFSERLARDKAAAVWGGLTQSNETLVLGADTIVVVDEHILGKPTDSNDAARMLRLLSGRAHQVITGICLLGRNIDVVHSEKTMVHVDALSEEEIAGYIATGEPMDKAGAYGIQGVAARWIPRVEGDYSTIVGLPIAAVYRLLRAHGAIGTMYRA